MRETIKLSGVWLHQYLVRDLCPGGVPEKGGDYQLRLSPAAE